MKLICEHLSKYFLTSKGRTEVLEDIDFKTEPHDFICILGPNGCGKTTLLKIIAGIIAPSSGRLYYSEGHSSAQPAFLIFQEHELFPWLNVMDNICFCLEMKGMPKSERYSRAKEFIQQMGLSDFVRYYPHQLSTGMKQKVNLIRGLLTDSPFLLIDEPSTSLDIYSKMMIQQDIYRAWKEYKKTIIYITHDIEAAFYLAQRIWILGKSSRTIIKKIDLATLKEDEGKDEQRQVRLDDLKKEIMALIFQEAQC